MPLAIYLQQKVLESLEVPQRPEDLYATLQTHLLSKSSYLKHICTIDATGKVQTVALLSTLLAKSFPLSALLRYEIGSAT